MDWQQFFAMGGYAVYVWTAYGFTALVLAFNLISPLLQRRQWLQQAARKLKRNL